MQLILVRHADADAEAATDAARPLTPLGHAQAAALCRGLRRAGVVPDLVLSSPAVRARDTAAALLSLAPGLVVTETAALRSGRLDPAAVLAMVAGSQCAVAVCHMPDVAAFAEVLLTGAEPHGLMPFEKCAAASFSFRGDAGQGAGVLDWFVSPAWFAG